MIHLIFIVYNSCWLSSTRPVPLLSFRSLNSFCDSLRSFHQYIDLITGPLSLNVCSTAQKATFRVYLCSRRLSKTHGQSSSIALAISNLCARSITPQAPPGALHLGRAWAWGGHGADPRGYIVRYPRYTGRIHVLMAGDMPTTQNIREG